MAQPEHDAKVARVAEKVRAHAQAGERVRLTKRGVSHMVPLPGDKRLIGNPIDLSPLSEILEIDPERLIAVVEPGVTFGRMVRESLKFNLIPAVVPELVDITLGGAVAGCSVEAMSHKVGGFHDTALEYEVVTGAGEVLTCSREKDPLLFEMVHGSLGTLGILTRITFRLVPAKQFVRLTYVRRDTIDAYHEELLARSTAGDHDFVDGIVHAPDHLVVCLGDFVDSAPYVSDYKRTDIFWKSTAVRDEDYLPTWDYCFRYDAECHWMSKTVPPLEWKPVRFLLGRYFLGSTNMIATMKRLDWFFGMKKRQDVVCDVFIPNRRFADFLRWYQRAFDFWPLWIVPYRMPKPYPWLSDAHQERFNDEMHFDLAVYGMPNNRPDLDLSAELERAVFEHDGIKTLIGRNHYDDDRFWDVYSRERYYGIKDRTDPSRVLPDLKERFARVE